MKTLGEGKFLRLIEKKGWEYAERTVGTGVVMVAGAFQNKLILIEQFRPSVGKNVIELPAGIAGDGAAIAKETMVLAARRELLEETGYEAEKMTLVCEGPVSSGLSNEVVSFFVAQNLKKVGKGGGDATENIRVHEIPLSDVLSWAQGYAKTGALIDPKIYTGLYFVSRFQ